MLPPVLPSPTRDKVGNRRPRKRLSQIWKIKAKDMNAKDEPAGIKVIAGTARNMGIEGVD
jgi:large subunit ribosomal protein L11